MKVYICSPLRGDIEANIKKAQQYCRLAIKENHFPIAPHIYFTQFLDDNDPSERKLGMKYAKDLLYECDALWVCGDKISEGMAEEIAIAKERGIIIEKRHISAIY